MDNRVEMAFDLAGNVTRVLIGPSAPQALRFPRCVVAVTDERVAHLHAAAILESLRPAGLTLHRFVVPAGETCKSLAVAGQVYEFLMEHEIRRDSMVLAVGGGAVSDLAGFVAGTWMRGIGFAIVPTTLEACVDACLGGKTAVNLPGGKNLVGVFHPASLVAIDPALLRTLDRRDLRAGLAESVKHALITSAEFLSWHEQHVDGLLKGDEVLLGECIERNLRIKGAVVARDPFERTGERAVLNFGHTIGHALETVAGYRFRHGECVALGMVAACRLSERFGLDPAVTARVESLLDRLGLPARLPSEVDVEQVMASLQRDKKAVSGRVRFVLLEAIGKPVLSDTVDLPAVHHVIQQLRAMH